MVYVQAAVLILAPAILSVIFYFLHKWNRFDRARRWSKQIIYGLSFGLVALGITPLALIFNKGIVTASNALALIAGLYFGAPAGLLTGFLGGLGTYLAVPGLDQMLTYYGGIVSAVVAGILAAALRRFMFKNKDPNWVIAIFIAALNEILHMLFIIMPYPDFIRTAFLSARQIALYVLIVNLGGVLVASIAITLMRQKRILPPRAKHKTLAQLFSRWLSICVFIAFVVTSIFIYILQTRIARADAIAVMKLNIADVGADIKNPVDSDLASIADRIATELDQKKTFNDVMLTAMMKGASVSQIDIVDRQGIVEYSTNPDFVGFDIKTNIQSSGFMPLLKGSKNTLVQRYYVKSGKEHVLMKIAASPLREGGFVQVGMAPALYQSYVDRSIANRVEHRHVSETGIILIANKDFQVVSTPFPDGLRPLSDYGLIFNIPELGQPDKPGMEKAGQLLVKDFFGSPSYVMYGVSQGYYIVVVIPMVDVFSLRDMSVYVSISMEILIFTLLFLLINILLRKKVVNSIQKVNSVLGEITAGNLEVSVEVRNAAEFDSLSDDINSTVQTLKGYIAEAAARIDRELEFAKTIQSSTLPTTFPAFPERADFDIFASMDPAKEVGGDFYDFYMLDSNHLAFLVADVSGKGISAAMFMMKAKTLIKGYAERNMDPAAVLSGVNNELCENNEAEMFVTCWMGIVDLRSNKLTFANAGHNPPMIRHRDGRFEYFKTRPGLVLAAMEGIKYRKGETELLPGDQIFLYTDGVTEATNAENELYGEDRLSDILNTTRNQTSRQVCKLVHQNVDEFVAEAPQFDDITMMCIKLAPKQTITVKPSLETMGDVISFVEDTLADHEVPLKIAMKINIAVDEVYSNIARYSDANKSSVEVVIINGWVKLTFIDDGKPYDPLEKPDPDITLSAEDRPIGGLGIYMIKKTMDDMSYAYKDGHNVLIIKKKYLTDPDPEEGAKAAPKDEK